MVVLRFALSSAADRSRSSLARSIAVEGVDFSAVTGASFLEEVLCLEPERVFVGALGDLGFFCDFPSELSVDLSSFLPAFSPLPFMGIFIPHTTPF